MSHRPSHPSRGARVSLAIATGSLVLFFGVAAHAQQAHVSSQENGQSLLLGRLGQCYAVTPAHVVGQAGFANLTGPNRVMGDAELLQVFGYDLALLQLNDSPLRLLCKDAVRPTVVIDEALTSSAAAVVQSLNDDGSIARRRVSVLDHDMLYLRVRPESANDRLFQGLSGSLIAAGEQRIGMLLSVDPGTGIGKALRYDRMLETVAPFFHGTPSALVAVAGPEAMPGRDLKVVSWSAPSKDAGSRAENLVSAGAGPWIATFSDQPVEVVLELNAPTPVSTVELSSAGCEDLDMLARDIEILGARDGNRFVPLGAATMPSKGGAVTVSFAPARLKRIQVRVHNTWKDKGNLTLGKVAVH